MGNNIKISATVLPRNIKEEGDETFLYVDVALNPYLPFTKIPDETGSLGLNYYQEIYNWHEYSDIFKQDYIKFRLLGFDNEWKADSAIDFTLDSEFVQLGEHKCIVSNPSDQSKLNELFWRAMFKDKTSVNGWTFDTIPFEIVSTLSNSEFTGQIVAALEEYIDELNDDGGPNDVALAHYLTDLRRSSQHGVQIITDPVLSRSSDPRLAKYHETLENIRLHYNQVLADLYSDLELREQKRRNIDNTNEFHKRFAAYSNHAFLLYKSGWIWTYKVNISPALKTLLDYAYDENTCIGSATAYTQIFLSIESNDLRNYRSPLQNMTGAGQLINAFHLSFLHDVQFLYPFTCIQFYKEANKLCTADLARKMSGSNPEAQTFINTHPKFGYLQINDGEVNIQATIIDRQQYMQKLEDEYRSIERNSKNGGLPGERDSQHRDLSNAIQYERQLTANMAKKGGGTEYANNGITIVIQQLNKVVDTSVRNMPANESTVIKEHQPADSLEGKAIVYRHNLIAGYRIDAGGYNELDNSQGANKFFFGSLCRKEEHFQIQPPDQKLPLWVKYPAPDSSCIYEGWIGASAQQSNSNKVYVDEELCRWNNWSLVCSRLENQSCIKSDSQYDLQIAVIPPNSSIVPQRFGWKYTFGIRPANICGGGAPPVESQLKQSLEGQTLEYWLNERLLGKQDTKCSMNNYWTQPIIYQRVDSVAGPTVVLGTNLFSEPKKKADSSTVAGDTVESLPPLLPERLGEDTLTMVIRSYLKDGELHINTCACETTRYFGPPPITIDLLMQHGAIDNLIVDGASRNSSTDEQLEKLRVEILGLAEKKHLDKDVTRFISKAEELDYLYDPLARGLKFEINLKTSQTELGWGMFGSSPGSPFEYIKECYWKKNGKHSGKNHTYFAITLKEKAPGGSAFSFDPIKGEVTLRQGCEAGFTASCIPHIRENDVELFYPGVEPARKTKLKLIHAVQFPCLIDTNYISGGHFQQFIDRCTINLVRFPDKSVAMASLNFEKFPIKTSEAYFLHIQYIDFIGDRTAPFGYRLKKVQKVVLSGFQPLNDKSETNVSFANLEHSFDNTMYRAANYRIEAVSRFKKYYPPFIQDFSVYGILRKQFSSTLNITDNTSTVAYGEFVNEAKWIHVQSTACPAKPVINKVTPLIDWVQPNENSGEVERICNRIRIYFDGEWYSSGAGEKIAVFFMDNDRFYNSSNVTDFHDSDHPISLQGILSQFGKDPSSGDLITPINLIDAGFFDNKKSSDFVSEIPLNDLQFFKPPSSDPSFYQKKVKAVLYDIQFESANEINALSKTSCKFDEQVYEGRYYIDITIDRAFTRQHYCPFVRFALARYQQNSIYAHPDSQVNQSTSLYYRFSEVVVTDFVQLLPERKIKTLADHLEVTVPSLRQAYSAIDQTRTHPIHNILVAVYQLDPESQDVPYNLEETHGSFKEKVSTHLVSQTNNPINIQLLKGYKTLHLLEYENYDSNQHPVSSEPTNSRSDDETDLRNDHKKRLIFSYTHKIS